jgi:hypothetical protein
VLQRTLDDLIDRGVISSRDIDSRIMDALEGACSLPCTTTTAQPLTLPDPDSILTGMCALADLGDGGAANAVQRFSEANFSRINNRNGFLMVSAACWVATICNDEGACGATVSSGPACCS